MNENENAMVNDPQSAQANGSGPNVESLDAPENLSEWSEWSEPCLR